MCNRYGYLAPVTRLTDAFSEVRIPLIFPDGVPNLAPQDHIRPTDVAPVIRPLDAADPQAGVTLAGLRWWLIPFFHKGPVKAWKAMCTNARAETVATTPTFREAFRRRRCLVPASCWYEWTGPTGGKTMWRLTASDSDLIAFAGLWDRAHTADGVIESFTILTCAAGPDGSAVHSRQPVVLAPEAWGRWLDLTADPHALLQAGPAGALRVERAEG